MAHCNITDVTSEPNWPEGPVSHDKYYSPTIVPRSTFPKKNIFIKKNRKFPFIPDFLDFFLLEFGPKRVHLLHTTMIQLTEPYKAEIWNTLVVRANKPSKIPIFRGSSNFEGRQINFYLN